MELDLGGRKVELQLRFRSHARRHDCLRSRMQGGVDGKFYFRRARERDAAGVRTAGIHHALALRIRRIVPGHGPLGHAAAFDHLIGYLWWLLREVDAAIRLGLTSAAAAEAIVLDRRFLVSRFSRAAKFLNPLLLNFHRLNVLSTYRTLELERKRSIPARLRREGRTEQKRLATQRRSLRIATESHSSRCTVSMAKAGRHTAMYSAPPCCGVE